MQLKTLLLTPLAAAGMVSAAPTLDPKLGTAFEAIALRSTSPIHFKGVQASESSLLLGLPKQGASCGPKTSNSATFWLNKKGVLSLYSTQNPHQELYVDRSGMGQGRLGYTTGAQPAPRNAEREGWKIDNFGNLSFDGKGFIACPSNVDGAYSIWVSAGVDQPGGNKDCLGFTIRTVQTTEPNDCLYTS